MGFAANLFLATSVSTVNIKFEKEESHAVTQGHQHQKEYSHTPTEPINPRREK
jgi:UDP-2,3-diacylglucosamine pyrophosphatase LpxH